MTEPDFPTAVEFDPRWDDEPYTMVPTEWGRSRLHWEDMGFLFWSRTHRRDFRFTETFMIGATPAGRDKVRAILRRLEKAGIIERRQDRDPKTGRITGSTFIVRYPAFGSSGPRTEKPSAGIDQAGQGVTAGQTGDGFTGDGKAVRGRGPAQTPDAPADPSTEKPSVDADQGIHYTLPGQSIDGFTGDGFPGDGKSATKKEQLKGNSPERKTTTTPGAAGTVEAGAGAEPDGSGSSSAPSGSEHHAAAVDLLRAAVDATAAQRLTSPETLSLVGCVAALLARGIPAASLRSQLAPVTSPSTTHPYARLTTRLEEIAAGVPNPLAATAAPAPLGVVDDPHGGRRLAYRPCGNRDCTGGGLAVKGGTGTFRRRIDPDTGALDRLCDHPVALQDGQIVTCHPDATLTTT